MSDHRRRRMKSDEDSEDPSSESEAVDDVEAKNRPSKGTRKDVQNNEDDFESPTELIDEEGGEEGIAEPEEVSEGFLGEELSEDASDENEDERAAGFNGVGNESKREKAEDGDDEEEEDDDEEEGCVEEERQQGDGEECSPAAEKELDFDEDRRNPQYIPKKGTFYEHDDRNIEEIVKEKEPEIRDKKKKKLWLDEGKWGHDRYREVEQTPKSRDEIVQVYGYDIRNEDCPPRARRRRRYGRGPTKYDRNWKDETAYGKERVIGTFRGRPRGGRVRGRGRGPFHGRTTYMNSCQKTSEDADRSEPENDSFERQPVSKSIQNSNVHSSSSGWDREDDFVKESIEFKPILDATEFPSLPKENTKDHSPDRTVSYNKQNQLTIKVEVPLPNNNNNSSVKSQTFENSNLTHKDTGFDDSSPRRGKLPPFRGRGSYKVGYKRPPRGNSRGRRGSLTGRFNNRHSYRPNLAPRLMDKQIRAINSQIDRLTLEDKDEDYVLQPECLEAEEEIQEQSKAVQNNKGNELGNVNVAVSSSKVEDSSNRPKRYSSLRQRGVQETTAYQPAQPSVPSLPPQHNPYFEAGYQPAMYTTDSTVANSLPQSNGSPPIINPPQYQTYNYQESYALRLPMNTTPPRLFPQVTLPAPQTLIAPTPPCITPNPGIINYPAPPPPPSTAYPQFTYQQYTAPPPPPPPPPVSQPPPDLYRGGITYYFPQTQPQPVRHVPQKRPKVAIPIVPPPENEKKLTEKVETSQNSAQLVNSSNNVISSTEVSQETDPSVVPTHAPLQVES